MLGNIDADKLFFINLDRYKMHLVLAVVAVLSMNYRLMHLIKKEFQCCSRERGQKIEDSRA